MGSTRSSWRDRLRQARTRRVAWGIADQGLFTLTNFVMTVVVARLVSSRAFGAYALVISISVMLQGGTQSLVAEPLAVRFSRPDGREVRAAVRGATGLALAIGVVGSVGMTAWGLGFPSTATGALLGMSLVLPAVLVQNVFRYSLVAQGRAREAFLNDVAWAVTQAIATVVVLLVVGPRVGPLVVAWGIGGLVGAIVGAWQVRVVPAPTAGLAWFRSHRDLGLPYLGEYLATNGSGQATMWIVGLAAGLSELAWFRGGWTLLGPVMVLTAGLRMVLVPEAARVAGRRPAGLERLARMASAGAGLATLAWGAIFLVVPDAVGVQLLGATWAGASLVVAPLLVQRLGLSLALGPFVGLRGLADARRTMVTRTGVGVLSLALGAIGAVVGGAVGAATGLAVAQVLALPAWWHLFRVSRREAAVAVG
ncbi:hypothetical protein [Salsipaludibacter albus]|uniref:hypothetical protein n=1 Tax=Salsipaludibacter albus TaxID=2849650 RepID=UPI001EE3D780|nr:hypothetical protein [Salsipaludibacter albus]MBY5163595.1 hypothetical protein [Salsipaludibacter albus]